MPGTLYVVATPIGNLEDFTFRGVRTLREVDLIAAEDTRRTAKLLAHYEIQKPLVSLHEHNEGRLAERLVARLAGGESIALVSDAGTPAIADPGADLVAAARNAGIRIVPIPGASAIAAILSVAGMPASHFLFLGFPPPSGTEREQWFERLQAAQSAVVLYEAPHRIDKTLASISEYCGERPILIGRELTKINEELVEWGTNLTVKALGEFVVVVGAPVTRPPGNVDPTYAADMFGQITDSTGLGDESVTHMLAAHFAVSPVRIRNLVKKGRILRKRERDRL